MTLRHYLYRHHKAEEIFDLLPHKEYHHHHESIKLFYPIFRQITMGKDTILMSTLGYRLLAKNPGIYIGVRAPQLTHIVNRAIHRGFPITVEGYVGAEVIGLSLLIHELEYIAMDLQAISKAKKVAAVDGIQGTIPNRLLRQQPCSYTYCNFQKLLLIPPSPFQQDEREDQESGSSEIKLPSSPDLNIVSNPP